MNRPADNNDEQKPFAAFIVERNGKMLLDDEHIYYNSEHYFWNRTTMPSVSRRPTRPLCSAATTTSATRRSP